MLGATVATRWFSARRGLVVGMLMASSATGQLLFLPLLASLTDRFGWRIALGFVCVMLLVAVVAVGALMRDRPADLNCPLTATRTVPAPAITGGFSALLLSPLSSSSGCGPHRRLLGAVRHLLHLRRQHQRPDPDALHRALRRLRPGGGRRGGRAGADGRLRLLRHGRLGLALGPLRQPLAALLVLWPPSLSLLYLPFTGFSFYGLSLFAVFYGLDWLATVPPTVKLTAERFGRERANVVFGWIFAGHQLGAATAAYGAGLTRTEFATYLPAFFAAGLSAC